MSKSNNRYGKTKYTMTLPIEAQPKPSQRLLQQWHVLDSQAKTAFGKVYDKLTDTEKHDLHLQLNTARIEKRKSLAA